MIKKKYGIHYPTGTWHIHGMVHTSNGGVEQWKHDKQCPSSLYSAACSSMLASCLAVQRLMNHPKTTSCKDDIQDSVQSNRQCTSQSHAMQIVDIISNSVCLRTLQYTGTIHKQYCTFIVLLSFTPIAIEAKPC